MGMFITLEQFQHEMRMGEYAENTIRQYGKDIREMFGILGETPDKSDLIAYKNLLAERLMPASVNRKLAAINCWLALSGQAHLKLRPLRIQQSNFTNKELTKREFSRLVNSATQSGRHQIAMIMLTLAATGIRIGELKLITVRAVKQGRVTIQSKGKIRTVLLPSDLQANLLDYCKHKGLHTGPLFVNRGGSPLSRAYISAQMKKVAQSCGVDPNKVYPHNLRHFFARRFLECGYPVTDLADHLGHSSVDTTRRYLLVSTASMQRRLNRVDVCAWHGQWAPPTPELQVVSDSGIFAG